MLELPDPFAVLTVDGEQTVTTSVIERAISPYWNDNFVFNINPQSILAVQLFDQKKFKEADQGFLGVVNVSIANVFDIDRGGEVILKFHF